MHVLSFIFAAMRSQQSTFHWFGPNWQQFHSLSIKLKLKQNYSLKTNLETLFGHVPLANWFNTIVCFLFAHFLIHLFLISCNLLRFCNHFWTFSICFYSFTNCFWLFLLDYQSCLLVYTRLLSTCRLYSFVSHCTHFYWFAHGSSRFIKRDSKIGFNELESSLASHCITTFQIKKRKKFTKDLFWGYILLRGNYNIPSE